MKHSFPRWFPYLLLVVMIAAFGGCAEAILKAELFSGLGARVTFSFIGAAAFVFLAWSFLYASRYSVQVRSEGVLITGAFQTYTSP